MDEKSNRPSGKRRRGAKQGPTIDLAATEIPGATEPNRPDEAVPGPIPAEETGAASPTGASPPAGDIEASAVTDAVPVTPAAEREPDDAHFGQGPRDAQADLPPRGDLPSGADLPHEADRPARADLPPQEELPGAADTPALGATAAPRLDVFDEPAPSRPSFMPVLAAALLGGVAGAAIVLAFVLSGQLPGFKGADETFAPRLVAIEQ